MQYEEKKMRIKIFVLLLSLFSVPCFSQKTFSFEKIDSLAVLRRIGDPRENYTLNSHDFDGKKVESSSRPRPVLLPSHIATFGNSLR